MSPQLGITYRNMEQSDAIEDHIERRAEKLFAAYPAIIRCEVKIEAPQKRQLSGRPFSVKIKLHIPGSDIHVNETVGRSDAPEDMNIAIHEAFETATRQLREHWRKMGAVEVKHHPVNLHGKIDRLFEGEGYGFISADNGDEVYFERDNLVKGTWDSLKVGTRLRFREMDGEKGPYAINVAIAE